MKKQIEDFAERLKQVERNVDEMDQADISNLSDRLDIICEDIDEVREEMRVKLMDCSTKEDMQPPAWTRYMMDQMNLVVESNHSLTSKVSALKTTVKVVDDKVNSMEARLKALEGRCL